MKSISDMPFALSCLLAAMLVHGSAASLQNERPSHLYRAKERGLSKVKKRMGHSERKLQNNIYESALFDDDDLGQRANPYYTKRSCGKGGGTCSPTTSPSASPTNVPTVSPAPSVSPSSSPSRSPTISPSAFPTTSPTKSSSPSESPTDHPTKQPSSAPTPAPTVSPAPSFVEFETETSNGLFSECETDPPTSTGQVQNQSVAFLYNMYVKPGSNFTESARAVETKLHMGLAFEFLKCDFGAAGDYHMVSISSEPTDTLGGACDASFDPTPPEASDCIEVNAEMGLSVYFPSARRKLQTTTASKEVRDDMGTYLGDAMASGEFAGGDIVQLAFQGFLNVQDADSGRDAPDNDSGPNGAIGGETNAEPLAQNNLAIGGTVLGVAAIVLIAALVATGRHRRRREEAYLHHLEEASLGDLSTAEQQVQKRETLGGQGKVHLVDGDSTDMDSMDELAQSFEGHELTVHDVHNCASATCPVCRQRELNPTFVRAPEYSIDDLQRLPAVMGQRSNYSCSDTVEL